jgi:hypothetical protein
MSGATDTEEATILDARLDRINVYDLALFTTTPVDAGTGGVEVSGGSYARVRISPVALTTDWAPAVGGAPSYKLGPTGAATWTFPAPTANWGTVVSWGLYESTTLRYFGLLDTSQAVNNGDPAPQFNSTHQIKVQIGDVGDSF